mgnify:CR=1 FL=1
MHNPQMLAINKGKGKGHFYLTSVVPSVPTRLLSMEADVYNKPAQYYTLLTCRLILNHWNFRDFRIIDEFLILNNNCENV